jgi:type I restriction enzyme S subunit
MAAEWHKTVFGQLLAEPVRNGIYKKKEFHGRGAKIVNMGELFAYPRLHSVPMKRVELSGSEPERFSLQEGDLLFARRSLVAEGAGKCSVVLEVDEPTTFESSIIRARPDSSKADSLFLYYFFNSPHGLHKLDTIRRHVAVAGITGSDLAQLDIPVPSIHEQRAIAHILDTLDDKIELNRQMNETLEAMARAIFKSWFVDFDPVRAKIESRDSGLPKPIADLFPDCFEDSKLGEIPKGWSVRALYECAEYINGVAFRNDHFSADHEGLPVIKIGELKNGITGQTKFTEAILEAKYRITSGDILFSWSGSPDTSIDTFVWVGRDGWLNQHIFKIRLNRPEEEFFVYFLLRHFKPIFIEIARNKQTTGLGHVTAQDLKRLTTVFPPMDVLRAFNRIVQPLFEKAYCTRLESCTLAALRDTLLPKLISGEVRVHDAERFTAEATA